MTRARTLFALALSTLGQACATDPDPMESKADTGDPGIGDTAGVDSRAPTDTAVDSASGSDTASIDTAAGDATAPSSCPQGAALSGATVVGGPEGATNVYTISTDTTHPDGYRGTIRVAGKDIEASDIEVNGKTWVVDGTKLYTLGAFPDVGKGEYYVEATPVGDAPGLRVLGSAGAGKLFGAGGKTLYTIDTATFAVTNLYELESACSEIIDFWAANSGGGVTFGVLLQCGTETKHVDLNWPDTSTPFGITSGLEQPALVGTARAFTFGNFAIGPKVYQLKFGDTAFTFVRDVDSCVDGTRLRGGRS